MSERSPNCSTTWQELVAAFSKIEQLRTKLAAECGQAGLADLVLEALSNPSNWRIALELYPYMTVEDQKLSFGQLLKIASSRHSLTRQFADAICAFPADWLLANIERFAEPLLKSEEAYWQMYSIYSRLDRQLASRLIAKATAASDPDIQSFAHDNA
jgi:hypothetical protein